jgi:hypothetical protein
MSSSTALLPFYSDPRGNRLELWTTTQHRGGHVLWLRGPVQAERQVRLLAPEYRAIPGAVSGTTAWTHALQSPEPQLKPSVGSLLDLLKELISLPSPQDVDVAVALDWYKIPDDDVDPYQWLNTEDGELVSSGKYRYRHNAELQANAGRTLVDRLCNAIDQHPILRGSTAVLDVPGHDARLVSFGSRLAATVAQRRTLPLLKVRAASDFRPPAKNLTAVDRAQMEQDQFAVPSDIRGRAVLIVDDVIRSGWSMGAVASAARRSQASAVNGICCVRTMRR